MSEHSPHSGEAQLPAPGERLAALDLLRGVAILGILPMNILTFALVPAAYQNPLAMGPISASDWWAWRLTHLFFDQKFMTLFAVLFGAGIVLLDARPPRVGISATARFYRRMAWLLVIGLLHAYGLWHGDILATYAVCAMIVFPMRRLRTPLLSAIAAVLLIVPLVIGLLLHLAFASLNAEELAPIVASWSPSDAEVRATIAAFSGSWSEQLPERAINAVVMQTLVFTTWSLWRVVALMLLGIVLLRCGFLQATWSLPRYLACAVSGFALGTAITGWGLLRNEAIDYAAIDAMTIGGMFNYLGSLFGAFGWASLVLALPRLGFPEGFAVSLEGVGRTSLSNYLLQTVLCGAIFFGHGLGWFGVVDRTMLLVIVALVWVVQIEVTHIWLRRFDLGPVEWAWRSLAAWKRLPLRSQVS